MHKDARCTRKNTLLGTQMLKGRTQKLKQRAVMRSLETSRPLRLGMRNQWTKTMGNLDPPVKGTRLLRSENENIYGSGGFLCWISGIVTILIWSDRAQFH